MENIKLVTPANYLFLGKTGAGKTSCFKKVYDKILKKEKHMIFVLCSTAEFSHDYDFVDDKYIITDPDKFHEKLNLIISLGQTFIKKNKNIKIYVIIDDALGVFNFNNKDITNKIVTARHLNISFILLLQQLTKFVEGGLRNNFKYLFINKISDSSNIKCLYDLTDSWDREKDCKNFIQENCIDYNTIFIDNGAIERTNPIVFNSRNL